jgi:hypothetical protein
MKDPTVQQEARGKYVRVDADLEADRLFSKDALQLEAP